MVTWIALYQDIDSSELLWMYYENIVKLSNSVLRFSIIVSALLLNFVLINVNGLKSIGLDNHFINQSQIFYFAVHSGVSKLW